MTGRTIRRTVRLGVLGLVLALTALVVPNATVASTEVALFKVDDGQVRQAQGVASSPGVTWILAVGSDARPGQDMLRSRGDAIQVIGLNGSTGAATSIGIPRDSWVPIPGHGSEKINSSLYLGGPDLMARTVSQFLGVDIDYVMVTRFEFFSAMVDDIGGIEVQNPRAFSDVYLKPKGFKAGRIHLDGYEAMAFSRIRKAFASGDFERSANQQRTLRGIHRKIVQRAAQPGFLESGVLSVVHHLDTDLGPGELFELAGVVASIDPGRVTTCVVPGGIGNVGAQSVVFPNVGAARGYVRQARKDATIEHC